MKLTVFNVAKDLDLNIGDEVILQKGNKSDAHIECFFKNKKIGNCAENSTLLIFGTNSSRDAIGMFSGKDKLTAKVVETNMPILFSNGRQRSGCVIFIDEIEDNSVQYRLKISGNTAKAPAKTTVIKEFKLKTLKYITIQLTDNNEIAVIYNGKVAGICNESESNLTATKAEIQDIKTILASKGELDATIVGVNQASYEIELTISKESYKEVKETTFKEFTKQLKADNPEIQNIVEYLKENDFTVTQIDRILKSHKVSTYPDSIKSRIPKEPKIKYIDSDTVNALKLGYGAMLGGLHLICKGPKGAGKNEFTKTLAWIFQRPLYEFSTNRDSSKEDIQGNNVINSKEENGVVKSFIEYKPEILLEAMECGGIFVIDEINFADPSLLGVLNSATDSRRTMEVPGYKKVVAHPDFVMIGTMNPNYVGTGELNEALNDRFVPVVFDYHESIFGILKINNPKTTDKELSVADNIYKDIKKLLDNNDREVSDECLTIRGFNQALYYITQGILNRQQAYIACVANKMDDARYRESLTKIILRRTK